MGQAKRRIGHQGVPGAYSDLAATSFFAGMDYEKKAFPYFEDVVVAVMDGTIDYGVLPIENSSTGGITDVYDLIRKYHAYIVGEKIVKVEHCLLVYDDTQLEEIREVYSHPQGLSQCHAFFRSHPFLRAVPCSNTAEAARMVAERKKPLLPWLASKLRKPMVFQSLCAGSRQIKATTPALSLLERKRKSALRQTR